MAKYKAYPEYKDSGVEWLGVIPSHWVCTQVKYGYDVTLGKMLQKNKSSFKDELKPYLKAQNIQPTGIDLNVVDLMWFSPEEQTKLLLKPNDVLISEGGDVGRSTIWLGQLDECYIQNAINRARAIKGNSPSFLNYWMISLKSADFINTLCNKATIAHYTVEKVETSPVLLPTSNEQLLISAFLDHETAKIDNLIEKQQQLIELLKEKRQAVISHAVTKGLNPDVPMKDSGVELLGEVPEHWLCTKIKHIALLTPKKSAASFKPNDECTFIPMDKLKRNSLVTDESKFIREVINGYTYFEENDLLLAKVTPCFENKNIAVASGLVNRVGFGSTEIYVLRPTKKVRVNYLLYRLQEDNFIRAATGVMTGAGGLKRVPSDFLLNYPIAIPPKSEMDAIVDYLGEQEARYDLVEKNATNAVQLLQERRTALISAAVTGKIDVRNWVAPNARKVNVEVLEEATA
jgi:type I restriction enzyme S subunit